MYKKLISVLLLAGSSISVIAQSTLTAANSTPLFWNSFINVICDTAGVNQGASGAGVTWNFSTSLVPTAYDTGSVYPCSATPNCSLFSGSTYAIVSRASTLVSYYDGGTSVLSQNGFYESADTFGTYTDPIDLFQYPFTYGTNFTDSYSGILHYGTSSAVESGTINVVCDGYGTLILPGLPSPTTFSNVLRVHTTQLFTDSLSLFGLPVVGSFTLQTYAWYMPNYHGALMTIAYSTGPAGSGYNGKAVSIAPAQIDVAVHGAQNVSPTLELFPNPVQNELNIRYNTVNNENVHITLSDMLGREVAVITDANTQGIQQLSYNTSALAKGTYLVRFQTSSESITRKVEVR